MKYSSIINAILRACQKASHSIIRDFGELEKLQISKKGVGDFVTHADIKAENILVAELKKSRPNYWFLVEEQGEIQGPQELKAVQYRWVIDPIDGTMNFMHGNSNFCISIALEYISPEGEFEIIAGVIYAPILNETYWVEKGKGAYLINYDGREIRLRVANRKNLNELMYGTNNVFSNIEIQKSILKFLIKNKAKMRISGSAALDLAHVASGRLDLAFQANVKPWDNAVGNLLVQEAGGVARNLIAGNDYLNIATNETLYSMLYKG